MKSFRTPRKFTYLVKGNLNLIDDCNASGADCSCADEHRDHHGHQ